MENIINKYPNIISDFSQLIKFSFNKTFKYFNQKITNFKAEYYFLINVNESLFFQKNNSKIIDEIIKVLNNIKANHKSAKIKIFTYKKYVKEIIKIKKDDEKIDDKKLIELLMKEIDESPQSDVILSLSDLYMKIEKYLIKEENEKRKMMKIIIINNEQNNYNEKKFEEKTLENVLNEFINDNSCFFGVEFIYLNNKLLENKLINEIINNTDDLLKQSENINMELNDKWQDITSNEYINEGIKKLDELLKFFKNVLNSIFFIKNKYKNSKDDKIKEKIEDYINISNLNGIKDGIISSDINESYMEELNNYKNKLKEIENGINKIKNEEEKNQKENNSVCINEINKYLTKQKEYILKFLEILEKSTSFIDSIEKEIIKQTKDIIPNAHETEKSEEEESEEEEK